MGVSRRRPPHVGPGGGARQQRNYTKMRIVELRLEGKSYRQIADELRISPHRVTQLAREGFAELEQLSRDAREDLVFLHHERLEYLYRQLLPQISGGSTRAVEIALKVLERQSKLHGLDAPEKKQVDFRLGDMPDDQLLQQARNVGVEWTVLEGETALLPGEMLPASSSGVQENPLDVEEES